MLGHVHPRAGGPRARCGGGERQLPRQPRRRADDLDAARLHRHAAHPAQVRVPGDHRGARQAPACDRGVDRDRRAHAQARPTSCSQEYRERLREARAQAEEIVARARKAGEVHERESLEEAKEQREELLEQTRRDIEAETRRAIQEIRSEVADLTVLATEKVTRKALDRGRPEAPRRGGARASSTSRRCGERQQTGMEEIAQVYARSLFEVAKEQDKLDVVREQLGQFADALERDPRARRVLLLALLLHRGEEGRAGHGADRRRSRSCATSSSC